MIRILEAGRFIEGLEMSVELQREPVISIHEPAESIQLEMMFPNDQIHKYIETGELNPPARLELTQKKSSLDKTILSSFDIINYKYRESRRTYGPLFLSERYLQKREYYLMEKEGLANITTLRMSSYAHYIDEKLSAYYIKSSIQGPLAGKDSTLTGMMLDYWKKQGLCLMNNVIITEKPTTMLFVEGSIKTEAAKTLIEKFHQEFQEHALELMPLSLSLLCKQVPSLKQAYLSSIKKNFPVRIIREKELHEF